ncbi:cohesin domain-containing protein [Candidatus Parcubacteria bacterium]|nr:cohesin domain-containing protein [Candidatus Parcubacteria bacterium]
MKRSAYFLISSVMLLGLFSVAPHVLDAATVINIPASSFTPHANVILAPKTGSFIEGSTFNVQVLIDTLGKSINTIELHVKFDPKKLQIITPFGDKSIIALWLEPPSFSNTNGTIKLIGGIPNGIITNSGLITTITFKALTPGDTQVLIGSDTRTLANDGLGTEVDTKFDRASFSVVPKPPDGVKVFSETHPFSDKWYNNNNPVLGWEGDPGISDFSFILDNEPFTIPDNTPESAGQQTSYQNVSDGLSYFHIKARKNGVWGGTTHFLVRIDTHPPAAFKPTFDVITAAVISRKVLVSFFTTDSLSGIDHYEVGVIENSEANNESPVFTQSESPYQLPRLATDKARVIVRAVDGAGNVEDASLNIVIPSSYIKIIEDNLIYILGGLLALIILFLIIHYLWDHHVIRKLRRGLQLERQEELKVQNEPIPMHALSDHTSYDSYRQQNPRGTP